MGKHSIAKGFASDAGNIWFERMDHTWEGSEVHVLWGSRERSLTASEGLETHAYAFIHTDDIKTRIAELFGGDMQFDVIIGNPPYQMTGGGGGTSDSSIYHLFVRAGDAAGAAVPQHGYSVALDGRRAEAWMSSARPMLSDRHVRHLVDYPNSGRCFPV